jgi:hypothetical protein
MSERLRCLVPFCRRTRGDRKGDPIGPGDEWVCGPHWSVTDRALRRLYSLCRRRTRRGWTDRDWRGLQVGLWHRLKRQATERAVGLA